MGKSTSSGSQLVSSTAITGMPSLRASSTAMCSFFVSTTQIAAGTFCMSRRPPRVRVSLSFSRCSCRPSFLVRPWEAPVCSSDSSSFMRCRRLKTVWKFVSIPPSQRWFTYGMPTREACSAIASWACFLVPTNITEPPLATVSLMNA